MDYLEVLVVVVGGNSGFSSSSVVKLINGS